MMNYFKKIIQGFSLAKIKYNLGGILNPKRDWGIILAVSAAIFVFVVVFDIYYYKQIITGDMYVSVNRSEITTEELKSNDLQKILNTFEEKKAKIINLKQQNSIDPSL